MIDPEKGVYRGFTNIVTAVPHSIAYSSFSYLFDIPGVIFNRRRTLDYDTLDSFTTDQMSCCFVQYIFQTSDDPDDEEFSLVCDCQEGVQGRMFVHKIAIYFKKGKMVTILKLSVPGAGKNQPKITLFSQSYKIINYKNDNHKQKKFGKLVLNWTIRHRSRIRTKF